MKIIRHTAGILLFAVTVYLGLLLPRLDLYISIPGWIIHRSVVTHSILLPFLWHYLSDQRNLWSRYISLGLFLGMAVHLAFLLYPMIFAGEMTLYFPVLGRFGFLPLEVARITGLVLSVLWLAANIFWAVEYYLKSVKNKLWMQIIAYLAPVITFFFYMEYSAQHWMLPAGVLAAAVLISAS